MFMNCQDIGIFIMYIVYRFVGVADITTFTKFVSKFREINLVPEKWRFDEFRKFQYIMIFSFKYQAALKKTIV